MSTKTIHLLFDQYKKSIEFENFQKQAKKKSIQNKSIFKRFKEDDISQPSLMSQISSIS